MLLERHCLLVYGLRLSSESWPYQVMKEKVKFNDVVSFEDVLGPGVKLTMSL